MMKTARPKVGWLDKPYWPCHLLDIRLSTRSVYVQVWRLFFRWTFRPFPLEEMEVPDDDR